MVAPDDDGSRFGTSGATPISPRRLLDVIVEAVIVTDPAGLVLLWNAAAETLYGWSAEEVIGRNIAEVIETGQSAAEAAHIMDHLRAGKTWEGQFATRRRDGSTFTAQFSATPELGQDGVLVGVIGVSSDVSNIGWITGEPKAAEVEYRAFVENSGDLLAVTDAEGVITTIAGPVEKLVGLPPAALIGANMFEFVQPSDLERAQELWARRRISTTPMPAEDFWLQRADGRWVCLSLLANNLLADPLVKGMVVTLRDVTERKHLEDARRVLSGANSALVLARSEAGLFHAICRLVVAEESYHLAWIGFADAARPLGVRMVAFSDHSGAYFDALELLTGAETYRGPLVRALETNELYVVQDIAEVPETERWRQLALDYGFRSLIALPLRVTDGDSGVLAIYAERPNVFSDDAIAVLTELASDISYGIGALRDRAGQVAYRAKFEASLEAAVRAIATAAELRDPYTAGHQRRVSELAGAIAAELGIDAELVSGIRIAASIHDIGKLIVPAEILSKPGVLTKNEFALIKQHAQAGHDIVVGIDFPFPAADMILQHHERLDGSGYPQGLSGEEITIGARIIAVADVIEAMRGHRPYRPSLGIDAALQEITNSRGTLYDPSAVDACILLFREKRFAFS
jgi:PAS domain S-box-containing protein